MMECGKRIPDSEHAVSVSLPSIRDVIGYEERAPRVMRQICSGYPRFVEHWMVRRVQERLGERVIAVRDDVAVQQLCDRVDLDVEVLDNLPFGAVRVPRDLGPEREVDIRRFLQHTGLQLSSRQAEDLLVEWGLLPACTEEGVTKREDPSAFILERLAQVYDVSCRDVLLFPSGMAAFYAVFEGLNAQQCLRGRSEWLQVGWLYLDTSALLERYAVETRCFGVGQLDAIAAYLAQNHMHVAAVTTEVMTNPLLETTDVVGLSKLCRLYDIPLILDISMPTPVNVDVLGYADVVIESLTKFASGHADVMAGAAIFRSGSAWAETVRVGIRQSRPYGRDLAVLADHIGDYGARMQRVNANAEALGAYFSDHPGVRKVHGAAQSGSKENYDRVLRPGGGYGGVLSVVFERPLAEIYDRLALLKGPSFGTVFTLCMPYVYLAHYDLVRTQLGRKKLLQSGVDPDLLRISVGIEPIDEIVGAFEAVL